MSFAINKKLDNLLRKQSYQKVKLTTYKSGHIVFDLMLNEKSALFLLDTGASGTILSDTCIEKFDLKLEDSEESATGAGANNLKLQKSLANTIQIKDKKITSIDLFVMDLEHVNQAMLEIGHLAIDGVLGADFLNQFHVVIDYKSKHFYML